MLFSCCHSQKTQDTPDLHDTFYVSLEEKVSDGFWSIKTVLSVFLEQQNYYQCILFFGTNGYGKPFSIMQGENLRVSTGFKMTLKYPQTFYLLNKIVYNK